MLQIAMTVGFVSPFAVAQRRMRTFFRGIGQLVRFGFGLLSSLILFALITALFTNLCPAGASAAPYVYSAGIFLATMLCVPVASLSAPDGRIERVLPWISAAAILVPAGVFSHAFAMGGWQPTFMLYLATAFTGGVVGTDMTVRIVANRPRVLVLN